MKRFTAFAVLLGAAMAACTSDPGPPVRTDATESVVVEFVELGRPEVPARVAWFHDDYDCYGRDTGGGFTVGGTPIRNAVVTTGKRFFTVQALYAPPGATAPARCDIAYSFPIESGGKYRIALTTDAQHCQTAVTRLPDDPTATPAPTPVEVTKRELLGSATDSDGPWCKPAPAYAGSSRLKTPRGK